MVQTLLEKRFTLRVRREVRPQEVLKLVLLRPDKSLGPDLNKSTETCSEREAQGQQCYALYEDGRIQARGGEWRVLASQLGPRSGLKMRIVDETGLDGLYDMSLRWTPEDVRMQIDDTANTSRTDDLPSFVTAVQQQLGLKLERGIGDSEVLIIESADRPALD